MYVEMDDFRNIIIKISSNDFPKLKAIMEQLNITFDYVNESINMSSNNVEKIQETIFYRDNDYCDEKNASDELDLMSENEFNVMSYSNDEGLNLTSDNNRENQIEENINTQDAKNVDDKIYHIDSHEKKEVLNIGGKKFGFNKKILDYLGIDHTLLNKTVRDNKVVYFLDRDPSLFIKVINIIQKYQFNLEKIPENIGEYPDDLVNELCYYELLDNKYYPNPKLVLREEPILLEKNDYIVKLIINGKLFETLKSTLSKSVYFKDKLETYGTKKLHFDMDPKIFRNIINFLRIGKSFIGDITFTKILDKFGIKYIITDNNNFATFYVSHQMEPIYKQISEYVKYLDPKLYHLHSINDTYQFFDGKYYYPENMFVSPNVEYFNVIESSNILSFDTELSYKLSGQTKLGDCIEDLILCIDIPVLDNSEPYRYAESFEYKIVDYVRIFIDDKMLMQTNGNMLYLYPIIYTDRHGDYHNIIKNGTNKLKLLYNNNLIDIHRIILPLFFFNRKNHLPIKKLTENKKNVIVIVKLSPLQRIFNDEIKEIPLLNAFLIVNCVNLASYMTVSTSKLYHNKVIPGFDFIRNIPNMITNFNSNQIQYINIPINTELRTSVLYVYNLTHFVDLEIQKSTNPFYDTVTLPLEKYGLIKDFFFIIIKKEFSYQEFIDNLIELEILQYKNGKIEEKTGNYFLYSKLDSPLLNSYIPIKRLGHDLPKGIYYYSFSIDPKSNKILGGLMGHDYLIRIKINKMDGFVKFFINEYHIEIF